LLDLTPIYPYLHIIDKQKAALSHPSVFAELTPQSQLAETLSEVEIPFSSPASLFDLLLLHWLVAIGGASPILQNPIS
jgi:hypothetical protein